jgi:putative ATPase
MSGGDARIALNALELAAVTKRSGTSITLEDVEEAIQQRAFKYDAAGDEHYDTISAFIKSMRGSDPDAALFWLHKMLVAGEDPEFVARRMIIFASEDIGNADPHALMVATSAAQALEWVGLPEASFNLSQAALYLAAAPKSDAVKRAMHAVRGDLEHYGQLRVPPHIRNAPVPDMKRHGASVGYKNPHAAPGHVVEQQYLPDRLKDRVYYEPTEQGFEKEVKKRVDAARTIIKKRRRTE